MKSKILMALVAVILSTSPLLANTKGLDGVVNINTASEADLMLLPGVGKSKATAIVAYRQGHPFKASEEITEVKGIGPKMFERLKPFLTVQGPTTLKVVASPAPRTPNAS